MIISYLLLLEGTIITGTASSMSPQRCGIRIAAGKLGLISHSFVHSYLVNHYTSNYLPLSHSASETEPAWLSGGALSKGGKLCNLSGFLDMAGGGSLRLQYIDYLIPKCHVKLTLGSDPAWLSGSCLSKGGKLCNLSGF